MKVRYVPVQANRPTRSSRLFSSTLSYLKRSIVTILRIYTVYEPLRTLFYVGGLIFLVGLAGVGRFLMFWMMGDGQGHLQSLIVSAVFLIIGFQALVLGIVADLISINRRLSEDILYVMRKRGFAAGDSLRGVGKVLDWGGAAKGKVGATPERPGRVGSELPDHGRLG
jgi:hypothetical protein